jgi:hypothetical protein
VESVWNWLIINVSSGVRASDLLPWSYVEKHAGGFVVTKFWGTLFSFICNEICFNLYYGNLRIF